MTVVTIRPNSTAASSGIATTGAASAHAALSDDSDSSYVTFDSSDTLELGLTDPSIPAGAAVKQSTVRVRSDRASATTVYWFAAQKFIGVGTGLVSLAAGIATTWSTPTTVSGVPELVFPAQTFDAATFYISGDPSFAAALRVYEAYLDITYVALPVVDANGPTSPVTTTNRPTVTWADTLDSDGGAQTYYQVRVFTDAQYLAGGFDPATSAATDVSGITAGAETSWQGTVLLPDDTYRAYVRVAQTVNGNLHWSAWDYQEFTVAVVAPNAPTLVATADNANGRIALAVTDGGGSATSSLFEFERSIDGGTTWESVRTLDEGGSLEVPHVLQVGVLADTVNATSHLVPLPAPVGGILADDLLIAFVAMDGNPSVSWPTGWTEIKDEAGNGSAVRVACAWKRASGGETGTITVTTSASEGGGSRILCIRDAHPTTAPEVSTGVSASTANADPDSLNPAGWGTENTLWIAAVGVDANVAVTAGPANFLELGNTRWADATNGAGIATAVRVSNAASLDPGAFTHGAEDTRAFTVAVRPRNAALTVYDYEAPNGIEASYRARAAHSYDSSLAYSAWSATDTETWTDSQYGWLKHPHLPALNVAVEFVSYNDREQPARHGIHQPLGATYPVVISDTRGPTTGALVIRTETLAERDAVDTLIATNAVLLLQPPAGSGDPDRFVKIGDHARERGIDKAYAVTRHDTLPWIEVAEPAGVVIELP